MMSKRSILITGVYGLVGSSIYRHLISQPTQYEVYGMARRKQSSIRVTKEEAIEIPASHFILSDLSDLESLEIDFAEIDTVVHMAANPNTEAPWESVLKNNVVGTYHVFEAAKRAGVRRVIYASTIQVSTGYALEVEPYKSIRAGNFENVPESFEKLTPEKPNWPVNFYAASKAMGETLARMYCSRSNLSIHCLRIGAVNSMDEKIEKLVPISCTKADIARLAECCIQAPNTVKFEVFYGMSDNDYRWPDLENAKKKVGYVPQDKIGFENL
ncbi:MAG: hypothetical protein CMI18_09515 [Opitutaceae bacterium]|nr:hypothetical protein [Opitutaceae bacterium]